MARMPKSSAWTKESRKGCPKNDPCTSIISSAQGLNPILWNMWDKMVFFYYYPADRLDTPQREVSCGLWTSLEI
eukprot:6411246-Ditylum_brightwellii.AAC.1